jgi:hypothetical protein
LHRSAHLIHNSEGSYLSLFFLRMPPVRLPSKMYENAKMGCTPGKEVGAERVLLISGPTRGGHGVWAGVDYKGLLARGDGACTGLAIGNARTRPLAGAGCWALVGRYFMCIKIVHCAVA